MSIVTLGFEYFPDPSIGRPVFNGSIYVGQPDTDPTVAENQKPISIRQENGNEISVAQPVLTSAGGVPTYLGSPVQIIVNGDYSLAVLNNTGAQVYYVDSIVSLATGSTSFLLVVEETILTDGQLVATFTNDLSFSSFYIGGINTDSGRLVSGDDYILDLDLNKITLTNSYPGGTVLTAAYNDTGSGNYVQHFPTTNRPPVGEKAWGFDTTLGIPVWSDGTNYVDATGSTV